MSSDEAVNLGLNIEIKKISWSSNISNFMVLQVEKLS